MNWLVWKSLNALGSAKGLLRGLWRDEGSVAQKAVRGGAWVVGGTGTTRLLQVVQTAILARLLVPADFGLMRLAVVAISACSAFSKFGIGAALVQRHEVDRRVMDTAWTLDLGRNLILFACVLLLAQPAAGFYGEPMLADILRLMSLKFLLFGLSNNAGMAMLSRDMRFRRRQIYELCLSAGGIAVTLPLAFWLRSVWALAWAEVYYGLGEMVGSYIVHPFRPRFRLYRREARSLISFGKHFFVAGVLGFLRGSLDSLLLGKLLGTEALGYYSLAGSLVRTPVGILTSAFRAVLYPAFSRLQTDLLALRRALLRSLGFAAFLISPMLVGIAVTAEPLVGVLYGDRYLPAVPLVVGFCAVRMLGFLGGLMGSLLIARGKPWLNNCGTVLQIAVLVPLLFMLAPAYGGLGALAALGLAVSVGWVLKYWMITRELRMRMGGLAGAVARPMGASLLMGGGVWLLGRELRFSAVAALAALVPAGVALYLLLSVLANRRGLREARQALGQVAHSRPREAERRMPTVPTSPESANSVIRPLKRGK